MHFARVVSRITGSPYAFGFALLLILVWAISGPIFAFSDTWQLVINTGTTVVTFLMVFLIQHTQNHDSTAVQLKLDELVRSIAGAQNALLDLEDDDELDLDKLRLHYQRLGIAARAGEATLGDSNADR